MANKTMKTLTIGENTYEIYDESARTDIETLQTEVGQLSATNVDRANSLWNVLKKTGFAEQLTDAEKTAFKTSWGITEESGGEEPDTPDNPEVTLSSISATYNGGSVAVGTALTDLTGITVTAHYSDGSTETVTAYTLSGEIVEGSNTITVSYGGKTTTFTITGIAEVVETWEEPMVLSYATSTKPAPSNDFTVTPTDNTGYANACSTNVVEHYGGVLYCDMEVGAFGFDVMLVLEDSNGTKCGINYPSTMSSAEFTVTADNTVIEIEPYEGDSHFIINKADTSKYPFSVPIPDSYKLACLFFRNMSDKANIIAQNGVTFTLKGA